MKSRKWDITWHMMAVLAIAALLAASCTSSNNGGGGGTTAATVMGKVLDNNGDSVSGAVVMSQNTLASTQTDSQGNFTFAVSAGAHRLTVTKNKTLVLEQCLAVAEQVTYDLGDIDPSTPTNCDVICTNGSDSDDRDCDVVPNDVELAGWDVTITLGDGKTETRHAFSDPDKKDTDGDGLNDGEEYAARTDPSRKDTDGDMLSDYAEVAVYKSNPLNVDSDGDSRGPNGDKPSDPNLWDGYELTYAGTSPTLADTDGDGLTDYEEIHSGGTNPRVADLPALALEVYGDPHIELNVNIVSGCSKTSIDLVREEKERVKTDNESTKMSIENTIKLHTETKAGTGTWPPSFNAELTTDTEFKHGYMHETSTNFTQTSVQDSQTQASCWEEHNASFANGKISVAMKLRNQSNLSFKVKELRVIAYQLTGGGSFRLIGTLEEENWPADGYVLGPYGDITMTVKKTDIGAETMKSLVKNPSSLLFEVGAYSLFQLDEWGVRETVNYAKLGESVIQRTGLIVIDYGDGAVERYMVATNVYRNPDGSGRGVTLKEALTNIIGLTYETEAQKNDSGTVVGRKVLKKVKTIATYQNDPAQDGRGFWIIGGTGDAFKQGIDANFDNIVIENGQRINLTYLKDTDLDGIFDNEEYLLGTNKISQDTDGDGLSDYAEAKEGWDVVMRGMTYHVYSDPRFADVDHDYLADSAEFVMGTDPYKRDTDGDGVADTNDPYPLMPPCLSGNALGLAGWWNGAGTAQVVTDISTTVSIGDPLGFASNGVLTGTRPLIDWWPAYLIHTPGQLNAVFNLNTTGPTQKDQSIDIADNASLDTRRSISPQYQFTLSAWLYWNGAGTGMPYATVMSKGAPATATYGLYVNDNGAIALSLYRSHHEKCWYCWFGEGTCDDGSCADENHVGREWIETPSYRLPQQTWVHVTATFGDERMRIYADGTNVADVALNGTWWSGLFKYQNTTNYLIINNDPLRIGLDAAPASALWPFRGMVDEAQVFGRMMTTSEVPLFNSIGVCAP
jgi:hypothetical protein